VLYYRDHGHDAFGFDIARDAILRARRRNIETIVAGSVTEIPFASGAFDLVFSFDVLEQLPVESVAGAMSEMSRVLRPGGTLFMRAPAFEWLRSSHDTDIQTVRRYTVAELERLMNAAGLERRWSGYANMFLFPVAVATRFLKHFGIGGGCDVRPLPTPLRWLNPVFREILAGELLLTRAGLRLPFGLSAICVARKP
jgi:SAM-dependent methyltransferase